MNTTDYLDLIFERRADARLVSPRDVMFRDGTKPKMKKCHLNVSRWVIEHPTDIAVRGWLVIGYNEFHGLFGSHSVVKSLSGELFDITPIVEGQSRVPFLPHLGSAESYEPFLALAFRSFTWPQLGQSTFDLSD